ncbi:MAG: hypothetical protein ABEI77_08790 [Halorientalis sp.]
MNEWEKVLYSVARKDEELGPLLKEALDKLNVSITEFAERSDLSESILYKISSGHRENVHLQNFQEIVQTLKQVEQGREHDEREFAVITNRESLERIQNYREIDGMKVRLREYPSSTVEEAIRQSILAERDGVDAIVCGPITAYTVEAIVYTPVIGLDVSAEQVEHAVETALEKTSDYEVES